MATIENFDHQQSTAKRSFDRCSRGDDDSAIQPSGAIKNMPFLCHPLLMASF